MTANTQVQRGNYNLLNNASTRSSIDLSDGFAEIAAA